MGEVLGVRPSKSVAAVRDLTVLVPVVRDLVVPAGQLNACWALHLTELQVHLSMAHLSLVLLVPAVRVLVAPVVQLNAHCDLQMNELQVHSLTTVPVVHDLAVPIVRPNTG